MSLLAVAALTHQAWITLGVVLFILGMLVFTRIGADVILVAAVTILVFTRVIDSEQAFQGMANEGMLTVAVLYVVACGLDATGATGWVVQHFLGRPRTVTGAIGRLMTPVAVVSGFLNNTPVVAMFMPAVSDWGKKYRLPVSKLMIPLSYAAVLGGCCTLIGTSTNLVVNGLLIKTGQPSLNMFDLTWVGLPVALVGIGFILATQRWLLPDRRPAISESDDPREYTVEMMVDPAGPLVGKTIEEAGLRHLPKMFVAELERQGQIMPAVSPQTRLAAGDRLVFVGVVDSVIDLRKLRGLIPATNQVFKLRSNVSDRCLIEAVVSERCPIVGQTIRDGRFRTIYNAAVLAVGRSGERLPGKIGDIVLRPGDTLLVEATAAFAEAQRNSRHFYLVSKIENSTPVRHDRALAALLILLGMVVVAGFEWMSMLEVGMLAAGAMLITRCCTAQMARRSVDWGVLIAIAASLAVGHAIQVSGLAQVVAESLIGLAAGNPLVTLAVIYGVCLLLTELVTNNAAAVLVFPIAMQTAGQLDVNYMPFVLAVALSASLGFATPLGYQTHLMVYGPGGYRFTDFLRIGLPLDVLCWVASVLLIPVFFPF